MKNKRFWLCILCVILAVFSIFSLSGCRNTESPEESGTADSSAAPSADDSVTLLENGKMLAAIVRPDKSDNADRDVQIAVSLRKYISALATEQSHITIATDWDHGKADDSLEILIGNTNNADSRSVLEELETDEFAIRMVGQKIILAGTTEKALQTAGILFENLLEQYKTTDENNVSSIIIPKAELNIRDTYTSYSDLFPQYGLCAVDTCTAYSEPTVTSEPSGITAVKYDVFELYPASIPGWNIVEKDGKTGYFRTRDVRVFEDLSRLKAYAAVIWARDIANDNDFHYGYNAWSHHYGCYFCGTNSKDGAKCKNGGAYEDQLKTYCCNPLVTAAYCHGAGAVSMGTDITQCVNCKISSCNINLANDSNKPLQDTRYFTYIEKPKSIRDLLPGDILLTPYHAFIVSDGDMIIEASGGDDNVKNSAVWNNSIRERTIPSSLWNDVTKIYRYTGG